jgi:hypothetical protein
MHTRHKLLWDFTLFDVLNLVLLPNIRILNNFSMTGRFSLLLVNKFG